MADILTLTITLRASSRVIVKYPINAAAAEREAREILRTWRGDTKIRKQFFPNKIVLTHKETYDKAVIDLVNPL